ncbi:hypothetical protein WSM22_18140 [Cytophagales bacterium WSM2-2]|nr:hypothetical protein WSM22_18140 [Cytophagales bacterium WSM2-2]
MAKSHYMPKSDKEKVVWLNNFSSKYAAVAIFLGFTPQDVTLVQNDALVFSYLVALVEIFTTSKERMIDYKNLMRNGPIGTMSGPAPIAPVLPGAPGALVAGIIPRIAQMVQRIKNSPNYTEAIGKDLGIIGAEIAENSLIMKPVLKLVIKGGEVEIQWVKGDADAVRIEADYGDGMKFLAIDTVPHYQDTTPITGPAIRKYRATYMVNDEIVGLYSDIASITVG